MIIAKYWYKAAAIGYHNYARGVYKKPRVSESLNHCDKVPVHGFAHRMDKWNEYSSSENAYVK